MVQSPTIDERIKLRLRHRAHEQSSMLPAGNFQKLASAATRAAHNIQFEDRPGVHLDGRIVQPLHKKDIGFEIAHEIQQRTLLVGIGIRRSGAVLISELCTDRS